jgi:hypothetical protein
MDRERERRIAANESLAREVNEAIERGLWPGEDGDLVAFGCECPQLDCNTLIELTPDAYRSVRAHPRRFAVAVGHELPQVETTVERNPGYVVVEKRDLAGVIAEAADPRE